MKDAHLRESPSGKGSKITSWVTAEDGTVVEADLKYLPVDEGIYELHTSTAEFGVVLGVDTVTGQYTVILEVKESESMKRLKTLVSKGDVVVAINDKSVLDEPFEAIAMLLDMLLKGSFSRKITFLNPKRCSLPMYLQRMNIEMPVHRDLLGFNCSFAYHLDELTRHSRLQEGQSRRDVEWVGYLKSIGGAENLKPAGVFKPSRDLRDIVRRGVPAAYRPLVWQKISLCSVLRREFPDNYYHASVVSRLADLDPKVRDEIEKDVDRTFPEHSYFSPSGPGEDTLRRLLQAFAVFNPRIGYCQGLNFIAGMMLVFMQEEDAFWLLVTVVERLLPDDYFTRSMVGTYVDQYVLAHIVKKCLPRIHSTFEKHQIQLQLTTVHWFMCVFVNTLRPEVTLRVWDMFLNEGSKVLFRISIALFKMNEHKFLNTKDAADLFGLIKNIGDDVLDADELIATAYRTHQCNAKNQRGMFESSVSGSGMEQASTGRSKKASSSDLLNPRLKIRVLKDQGAVPDRLIGVGLAHIGPCLFSSDTDSSPVSFDSFDLRHRYSSFASEEEAMDMTRRLSSKDLCRSTLQISGDLCSYDEYLSRHPHKLKAHRSKHKSGRYKAFDFYRADLALWRSSFRPALEERQRAMEEARESWRASSVTRRASAETYSLSMPLAALSLSSPTKTEGGQEMRSGHPSMTD